MKTIRKKLNQLQDKIFPHPKPKPAPLPPVKPSGLTEAIHLEASKFLEASGIPCDVEASPPADLPYNLHEIALQMVRACLDTTAQGFGAHRAWLRLAAAGKVLYIEAGDDGQGIDQGGNAVFSELGKQVNQAGGKLSINNQPGLGTVVRLELPF